MPEWAPGDAIVRKSPLPSKRPARRRRSGPGRVMPASLAESEARQRSAEALADVGRVISQGLDPDLVASRIAESVRDLLGVLASAVYREDPESGGVTLLARSAQADSGVQWTSSFGPGEGVVGLAIREGQTVATEDLAVDPRLIYAAETRVRLERVPYRAALAVPLVAQGRISGVLVVADRAGRGFTREETTLAQAFAAQAAVALDNARLYDEATRRQHEAETLALMARNLTESLEVADVGRRVVESVLPLFDVRSAGLRLLRPDGSLETVARSKAAGVHSDPGDVLAPGLGISGRAVAEGRPVRTANVITDSRIVLADHVRDQATASGELALLAVPLRAKGRIIGALSIADREGRVFSDAEAALLSALADQAATAIHNAQLFAGEQAARAEAEAAGRALRESEARLLEAQRIGQVGSWEADLRRSTLTWSEETYRIFGRRPGELAPTAEAFAEAIHPDDRDMVLRTSAEARRTGRPYRVEHRIILPDGSLRVVFEQAEIVRDEAGRAVRMVGTVQDITERKAAEERLRAGEERYRALVEHAPDAIVVFDPDADRFVDVNVQAVRLYRLGREELLARGPIDLCPPRQPDGRSSLEAGREWIRKALRGDKSTFEWTQQDGAGNLVACEVSLVRLPDPNRTLIRGSIFDITERKRAEETRAQLEQELRQAQKMEAVGRLAGGVAHDFNNLLTVIGGRGALMAAKLRAEDPLRRDVELIQATTQKAAALTQQLLAFSRKQLMQPKVLDLNTRVSAMEQMLRRLIGEDIEVVTELAPDLWRVEADPAQVDQVIMNLAVNARDAMTGGGRLALRTANARIGPTAPGRADAIPPGDYAVLSVADTGIGMTAETLARVFEPFFTTKEMGKGTGLGLSTVYGIVTQSGGHIAVESEPGRGTTFTVHLPRVQKHEAAAPAAAGRPARGRETVLLVEDEAEVRDLARDILEMQGYTVLASAAPADAERVCRERAGLIHLLLTDVVMPGMSGRALAERLLDRRPAMKVLYMSGYDDAAIVKHGVLDPGVMFLPKPFSAADLAGKVRDVLDRGQVSLS